MSTSPVVLTVRGTLVPSSLEQARTLHNETAGSPDGIAAARSLGDLSHKVYAPCLKSKQSGAKAGELLFVDTWLDANGIMSFFGNAHVQQQADKMFSARVPSVWMAGRGSFGYSLPAAMGKDARYLGVIRAAVKSPEAAIETFVGVDVKAQRDARRRGILSHHIFIKMNPPGDTSAVELLGLDLWSDFDGMTEHYNDKTHMSGLAGVFAGAPDTSVWEQPAGHWSEW